MIDELSGGSAQRRRSIRSSAWSVRILRSQATQKTGAIAASTSDAGRDKALVTARQRVQELFGGCSSTTTAGQRLMIRLRLSTIAVVSLVPAGAQATAQATAPPVFSGGGPSVPSSLSSVRAAVGT
jgi:hypothetical protein